MMSFDVEKKSTRTPKLDIEYLEWNPSGARTMVLVHGWPDSARTWLATAPAFAAAGFRVLAPSVRGYAGTCFLDQATPRSAQLSALGRDLLDFIDALGLHDPVLVGHDWGAPQVWNTALLHPDRIAAVAALSVPFYGAPEFSFDDVIKRVFDERDRFFYQSYFRTPGRAEAALDYLKGHA